MKWRAGGSRSEAWRLKLLMNATYGKAMRRYAFPSGCYWLFRWTRTKDGTVILHWA